ncbi:MAG: hypothetical protein JJ863_24675 [Deltaproteobacteria bacterium]|nr:hypothetical protein [Deltaproteobacteria bacterium]
MTGGPKGQVNFDLLTTTESRTLFRRAGRVTLLFLWDGATEPLIEIVDDLVMRAPLLQAVVGASGMPPKADFNPYEVACGIPRWRPHTERWAARWLLGCDTNLWLSQPLLDRVDTGQLDRVAVRSSEDSKHHVRLREGHTIEELELALAPILPSLEDWLQAQGPIGRLEWRRKELSHDLEGRLFRNEWFNRVITPKLVRFAEWRRARRFSSSGQHEPEQLGPPAAGRKAM